MEEEKKRKIIIGTLTSSLIFLSFVFFKTFSISSRSVIIFPSTFFKYFLSEFAAKGSYFAMTNSLIKGAFFVIPFIPLVLGFSVLIFYGVKFEEDKRLGFASSFIPSLLGTVFIGPSLTSIIFSLGVVLSGTFSTGIAVMYFKELKKWKEYRTGARTGGKLFLIINILLLFALLINTIQNSNEYTDFYKKEMKDSIMSLFEESETLGIGELNITIPNTGIEKEIEKAQRKMIESKVDEMLNTERMSALISFCVFLMPFMIFAILETLRAIIFSPLFGVISSITLYEESSIK
ncbi:MAG TPA: hypothetical protein ENF95_01335 [Candidatus Aenigmarchaeota archaeon]|nr:hypothetical protein [Candidatus Aenigmarchaeota archaeon]